MSAVFGRGHDDCIRVLEAVGEERQEIAVRVRGVEETLANKH